MYWFDYLNFYENQMFIWPLQYRIQIIQRNSWCNILEMLMQYRCKKSLNLKLSNHTHRMWHTHDEVNVISEIFLSIKSYREFVNVVNAVWAILNLPLRWMAPSNAIKTKEFNWIWTNLIKLSQIYIEAKCMTFKANWFDCIICNRSFLILSVNNFSKDTKNKRFS